MEALFLKLLNMGISAGWFILVICLLRLLFRNFPKWFRCALWGMAAFKLVCPFSIESVFSLIPSRETISPQILYAAEPTIDSGIGVVNRAVNPVLTKAFSPEPIASVNPLQIWSYVGARIWILGIAGMLLYGMISYLRVYRKVQISAPLCGGIRLCDTIDTPFIFGIWKPHIYLPSDLSEEQKNYVIAHEKAHLKRGDQLWKLCAFCLLSVYWFHPLVWLAYLLFCRDLELACDERVIKSLELSERKAYSAALLACSLPRGTHLSYPLAFGEVGVKERIKNVLRYRPVKMGVLIAAFLICVIIAVCFLTDPREKAAEISNSQKQQENTGAYAGDQEKDAEIPNTTDLSGEPLLPHLPMGTYEEMITALPPDAGYAFIDLGLPENALLLLVTDGVYEDNGKLYALSCDLYYAPFDDIGDTAIDEAVRYLGTIRGSGTAYPVTCDGNWIYTASGHHISRYTVDEKGSGLEGDKASENEENYAGMAAAYGNSAPITFTRRKDAAFDATPLEEAVRRELLKEIEAEAIEEDLYQAVSLITFMEEKNEDEVCWYGMVLALSLAWKDGIEDRGGFHMPMAFTFTVEDGGYTLKERWQPMDGSYYETSIRERFPAEIVPAAMDTQAFIYQQIRDCYDQVIRFRELDPEPRIIELLAEISSSPMEASNPADYIEAHPLAYRELLYYGQYTQQYYEKEKENDLASAILEKACAEIGD